MKMQTFVKVADGVILQTTKGQMKVQVCNTRIIRVVYTLNDDFSSKESLMVVQRDFAPVLWNLEKQTSLLRLQLRIALEDQ